MKRLLVIGVSWLWPVVGQAQELLANPGFEVLEPVCGFPVTTGDWGVDAAAIVGAEGGVTPRDGAQMLRLEFPFFNDGGAACVGVAAGQSVDVAQLIDVMRCHPAGTDAGLRYTAYFNRSPTGGADQFTCILRAYDGDVSDFAAGTAVPLDAISSSTVADTSTATWQRCEAELLLPSAATYVAAYLSASVVAGPREVYADSASLVPITGRCGFDCTVTGTVCPDAASPPEATLCDMTTGACVECLQASDCDDGNDCTANACGGGTCTSTAVAEGAPCAGGVCLGETCVECIDDGDCPATERCEANACVPAMTDAGTAPDVPEPDSGTIDDAGISPDTGAKADGGTSADTGTKPDAGRTDAGTLDTEEEDGCACSSTGRAARSRSPAIGLGLLLFAVRRRRRSAA